MTYETENDAEGLAELGNDNARRVNAGAEVFPKVDASAEASKPNNSTKAAEDATKNALSAALDKPVSEVRALAFAYSERWIFSTVPLAANSKAPTLPRFNTRTDYDPPSVFKHFSDAQGQPKDCNIGFVNGAPLPNDRELFIVDPDTKERAGGPGVVSFNQRIKDIGAAIGCPLPQDSHVQVCDSRLPWRGSLVFGPARNV